MSGIELDLEGIDYPVWIGPGGTVAASLGRLVSGRDLLVVTDRNVAPGHLPPVRAALAGAARIETLVLAPGEAAKTLAGFERILAALIAGRFHRDAIVVALGGGVVGDMAGFAAACYARGVDWIAVPTTLLSQLDAALGGKTGVNHPGGKNLVGAFHDPLAVWADPAALATLPAREYRAGFGEAVKYGLGFDRELFGWLESRSRELSAGEPAALSELVARCARIKLEVVAADRLERAARGGRILLNLGHTLGHALEAVLGYGSWLHGEAVAAGLVTAAELSSSRRSLGADVPARLRRLLRAFELPTAIPARAASDALMQALRVDKKIIAGRLRFIGLDTLGKAVVWDDVSELELGEIINRVREHS